MGERLAKGIRKHISTLKQGGDFDTAAFIRREESDSLWKRRLSRELEPDGEGLQAYEGLNSNLKSALENWFNIRYQLQVGDITSEEFHQRREDFGKKYGDLLDNPVAESGFRIILNITKRS